MPYRKELFKNKNIYYIDNWEDKFFNSVIKNLEFHINNNEKYKKFLEKENFDINNLKNIDDLYKIPLIPTLYFKQSTMYSIDRDSLKWILNSSGTSGNSSEVGFDKKSIYYGLRAGINTFRYKKLISIIPTNYIVLGYEPNDKNKMGAVKSAYGTTKLAPALNRTYALIYKDNKYERNIEGLVKSLYKYSKQNFPVRFVGFPSYIYILLKELKKNNLKFTFNKNSKIIMGGGWKEFSKDEIDKEEFYKLIYEILNISKENIFEFYSAVEHPIAYVSCKNNNFHQPIHSKIIVRNPKTFEPVKDGELGLISFITPLVESMPILSIATDDIGYMYSKKECGCGIKSPYFKINNRAGVTGIKTCVEQGLEI